MKRALLGLVGAVLIGLAIVAIPPWSDPVGSLLRAAPGDASRRPGEPRDGRRVQHVALADTGLGPVGFTLSLPDPLPAGRLPLIVVLGGAGTGEHNIRAIDRAGDNVVVGYDWPFPAVLPKGFAAVARIPSLRRQALAVPGQVGAMLRWLDAQPWADGGRISLVGFSLGAIAVPAAERVAGLDGTAIGWTVLAYGGAGLDRLVEGDQRLRPAWARPMLGAAVERLLRPIEPALHLPHLAGPLLILAADQDTIIDPAAAARLEALAPEPKTLLRTEGGHIGTGADRQALLDKAMALTRDWLQAQGATNPPAP
jgi:dienelactone hydrolase